MKIFEGYTKSGKHIVIDLDLDTGFLWINYDSGRRIRFNQERYTEDSDFSFLLNYYRKS